MIICNLIIYSKDKGHEVEIKTKITGDNFKIATMIFFDSGDFNTLGNRTDSKWEEVLQQHQRTVDVLSKGLGAFGKI